MSGQLPRRRNNSGRGLLLLAAGKREGFALFGSDGRAYLHSLAPLVAFYLVSAGQTALTGTVVLGATAFLGSLCSLLAPPVIAEPLCRRWGREGRWALYANLLNWTQMLLMLALAAAFAMARLLALAGLPMAVGTVLAMLGLMIYGVWFQWFTARFSLDLTRWQTTKLLLATQFGTALVVVLPLALAGAIRFD